MAQTNSQNIFVSAADQDLNIKSIVITPTTDNVSGIYAKPVEEYLRFLVNEDKQWSLADYPKNISVKTDLLDENPSDVKKIMTAANAEAVLSSRLIKGPRGLSITLTLYVGRDGLPLLQEVLSDYKGFEINDVKFEVKRLFDNLKNKMPFRATIMSRRGQQVTLSLGSAYGLKPGMNVSVVQVLKINRHPKLNFMIGTEKEVLGRVQLFKVEPYLSFGSIVMEKESGVITVGSKILPEEYIKYPTPVVTPGGKVLQDLSARPDKDVAFGDSPQEWRPEAPPQYGKIELLAGISSYTQNVNLTSAGSISGDSNFTPNIAVRGELWINPEWYLGFNLRQAVYSLDNSLSGSTPGTLNGSMSQYGIHFGYNFLLSNEFFGPKLQVNLGYSNTTFAIDDSNPTAFTRMQYGGMVLGFAGQFPISEEVPIDLGAKFDFYLDPGLSENKSSGASSDNKINSFGFFLDYRLRPKFKIRGELLFDYYSSDFSGTGDRTDPATSASHKLTTFMGGVQWLF
ncbi:hypothetical protein D3C87_112140 [compost metagenome]